MQAGRMRYRLTFEKPVRIRDESGEVIVDQWIEAFKVWGAVEPLTGREYMASAEFRPGVSTRIRVRWRDDLDTSLRVVHQDGTVYDIVAVLPVQGLHKEAQVMCGSGVVTEGGQP
ncbi:phage head closure protein [Paraburkholderia sp. RL18-103-BIB-C]